MSNRRIQAKLPDAEFRPVIIYASEIAKIIRCTDFARKDIAATFETIWKRLRPETYQSSDTRKTVREINQFVKQTAVVVPITQMTPDDVDEMSKAYKAVVDLKELDEREILTGQVASILESELPEPEKINTIKDIICQSTVLDTSNIIQNEITTETVLDHVRNLRIRDKDDILNYYESVARKTMGTCEESTVQDLYRQMTGKEIQENNTKTLSQKYRTRKGIRFEIRGKIDGMVIVYDGQKPFIRLVEIKNRSNRLFGEIPRYERIQLCFYLHFLELDEAELVERYKNQINIIPFSQNDALYKSSLKALSRSIDFMVEFWNDAKRVSEYKKMSLVERTKYLNDKLPVFI